MTPWTDQRLVDTLATTLPALDDAPAEMASELAAMAYLSNGALTELRLLAKHLW